jgi:hypothetical protein
MALDSGIPRNDGTFGLTHDQGRVSQGKKWGRLDPIPTILEPAPFLSPENLDSAALHPGSASGTNSKVKRVQGKGGRFPFSSNRWLAPLPETAATPAQF